MLGGSEWSGRRSGWVGIGRKRRDTLSGYEESPIERGFVSW